jgi:hypothetical protein
MKCIPFPFDVNLRPGGFLVELRNTGFKTVSDARRHYAVNLQ